jgi:hypothetical protein
MSMDYSAKITEDGQGIVIAGVQLRNEAPGHVWPIASQRDGFLAINLPPGSVWSGLGRPHRYVPASIVVFQLYYEKKELRLRNILDIPVKRKKS